MYAESAYMEGEVPEPKTLRDEFAMAALSGMMGRELRIQKPEDMKVAARIAFEIADAMLAARKK